MEVGPLAGFIFLSIVALIVSKGVFMAVAVQTCPKVQRMAELEKMQKGKDTSYVAYVAFNRSKAWRIAVSVMLTLELWSALVVNLVNAGITGSLLSGGMISRKVWIIIIEAVTLPMLDAAPWLFQLSSKLGLAGLLVCVFAFAISAVGSSHGAPSGTNTEINLTTTMGAFGICLFSFGNAPCLQNIHLFCRPCSRRHSSHGVKPYDAHMCLSSRTALLQAGLV